MLFVILPGLADSLATRLPPETEARFGRLALAQVEDFLSGWEWGDQEIGKADLTCDSPPGLAALGRLEARLTAGLDIGYDIELRVFDHEMVNAFALPGGHVVILRGLLDAASGPDEVAGVLAHEVGHVARHDPTRLMLRAAGSAGILSLVLGDISGGTLVAVAGEQLMQAAYTREAEAAADAFAFDLLASAGISAEPLAAFFDRIAQETELMPEYLSSHPASAGRAGRARDSASVAAAEGRALTPALSDMDWAALKAVCARG
jgi:Zn-dependent protease with chaperone function